MKKKIAKKRAAALGNITILGRNKAEICVKMYISFVYKGLECVDLQKRNRKQMYDQKKTRYNTRRKKFSALFLNFVLKKFILK